MFGLRQQRANRQVGHGRVPVHGAVIRMHTWKGREGRGGAQIDERTEIGVVQEMIKHVCGRMLDERVRVFQVVMQRGCVD